MYLKKIDIQKVIVWRVLSIIICVLMARLWFGDWHATWFGLFISILMTIIHYFFEQVWKKLNRYKGDF